MHTPAHALNNQRATAAVPSSLIDHVFNTYSRDQVPLAVAVLGVPMNNFSQHIAPCCSTLARRNSGS